MKHDTYCTNGNSIRHPTASNTVHTRHTVATDDDTQMEEARRNFKQNGDLMSICGCVEYLFVVTICVVTVCPVKKTPNLIVVVTNRYGDMDECQLVLWHMVP